LQKLKIEKLIPQFGTKGKISHNRYDHENPGRQKPDPEIKVDVKGLYKNKGSFYTALYKS